MAKPQAENLFFGTGFFSLAEDAGFPVPNPKGIYMKTQIELAREGVVTQQMQAVAKDEKMDAAIVRERVAKGQIVIPSNPFRKGQKVVGIGRGLRTKVNASIGTSPETNAHPETASFGPGRRSRSAEQAMKL